MAKYAILQTETVLVTYKVWFEVEASSIEAAQKLHQNKKSVEVSRKTIDKDEPVSFIESVELSE